MKFKGIFWKILLWFWLGMLAVSLAFTLSMWLTRPDLDMMKKFERHREDSHFMTLIDLYEEGKLVDEKSVGKIGPPLETDKFYIVDEKFRDVLNRKLPEEIQAIIDSLKTTKVSSKTFDSGYRARTILGESGKRYIVVSNKEVRPKRPGRMPFGMLTGRNTSELVVRVVLLFFTTFIVCYGLSWYVTKPVVQLQKAARELAGGKFDHRIAPSIKGRKDELIDLAHDFDTMAERIEELLANQQKLLGDISHELRTPLTRLNVALELAREAEGEELCGHLDRIERESARLLELITSIVTLVRLSGSEAHFQADNLDFSELCESVVSDALIEAKNNECEITSRIEGDVAVFGSRELLRRAMENLIRNGIRHSKDAIEVVVSQSKDDESITVTVTDNGSGIPQEELDKVFDPFYRCESARERQKGGVGLGLAIVKRAAKYHKGSVSAQNVSDGGLAVKMLLRSHEEMLL